MPEIDKQIFKEALKEAIDEWLEKKFSEFGKWTLRAVLAAAFAGAVYLSLIGQGWKR